MTDSEKVHANDSALAVSDKYTELFHYTSICALQGILATSTLWATNAKHLNDSSEMQLMWPTLERQCVASAEQVALQLQPALTDEAKTYAVRDGQMMADLMRDYLLGGHGKHGAGVPFVTSFAVHECEYNSEHGALSQWRGYTNDGGVAVVFDKRGLKRLLQQEYARFEYFGWLLDRVIYNFVDVNYEEIFPALFQRARTFLQHVLEGRNQCDPIALGNTENLAHELLGAIGRLKHQAFHEECEWRIVFGVPDERLHDEFIATNILRKSFKTVHHRLGADGSIPYIRLFEDNCNGREGHKCTLPIRRIIVGPSRNQLANVEGVKALIDRLAPNSGIDIRQSEIPYVAPS